MAVYDFTTPEGAPVRTETGVGRITGLDHVEGRRNAQVRITAVHLKQPVTGWVDTQGAMWPRVVWARENDAKVWYRVDTRRHREATDPVDTPLKDLDNMSKTRDLVRIEVPERAPADSTITLDPFADLNPGAGSADARGGAATSVTAPATATDGHAPQGPTSPPASAPAPPAGIPLTAPGHARSSSSGNRSPRPQSAPPVPGPALPPAALEALHDVVQSVHAGADDAWVADCCNAAVTSGASVEQVRHVLDRARRGLDVGLMPRGDGTLPGPPARDVPRDAARGALDRQRDPDGLSRPVQPGDVSEPHTAPGDPDRNLVGSTNGMSRRVSARGNVTVDGRPWDMTNSDGSTNYGSYAASAVGELVTMAAAQRMTRLRNLHAQDPDRYPLRMPTPYEVDSLARTLLTITDRVQVHLRGGGRPDRAGGSHKQARYALKEAVAVMPIPWGDNPAMARWVGEVELYACTLTDVIAGIVDRREPYPRDGAAPSGASGASGGEVPPGGPGSR